MIALTHHESFPSNGGVSKPAGEVTSTRGVYVNLGTGTAKLEISTPDGWSPHTDYTVSTTYFWDVATYENFRPVLAGNAKIYLL